MYKYIDDCTIFEVVSPSCVVSTLQAEVDKIQQWTITNNMRLNIKKTKEFTVSFTNNQVPLQPLVVDSQPLESVVTTKLLGVHLSSDLKWDTHIEHVCSKASKRLYALRILKRSGVPPADLRIVYCSFIRPILEYACPAWHSSLPQKLRDQVEQVQRRATKVILPSLSYSERLVELDLVTLNERRESLTRRFYSSVLDSSSRIHDILPARVEHKYCLRRPRALPLVKCNTKRLQNSFLPYAIKNWDVFHK